MRSHVTKTVSSCFVVLHQLQCIRRSVSRHTIASSVTAPLHCSPHLFFCTVRPHHSVPSPAPLAERVRADWFEVCCPRIEIHGCTPSYLINELCQVADVEAHQRLRSALSSSLIVGCTWLPTVVDWAFLVAAAHIWNRFSPARRASTVMPIALGQYTGSLVAGLHLFSWQWPCTYLCTYKQTITVKLTLASLWPITVIHHLLKTFDHCFTGTLHGSAIRTPQHRHPVYAVASRCQFHFTTGTARITSKRE